MTIEEAVRSYHGDMNRFRKVHTFALGLGLGSA
jgi:hypothetical protein